MKILFAFEGSRNTQHGHSHGHAKILNGNYETIKEVRSGRHQLMDLHEFRIVDEKTALVRFISRFRLICMLMGLVVYLSGSLMRDFKVEYHKILVN